MSIVRFFRSVKLYFTDRPYYYQWKQYLKMQDGVRKKLKKLSKEFCPWSGYYMHEMIVTMLEFYHKVYQSGYCCWSEDSRRQEIADQLQICIELNNQMDRVENLSQDELLYLAETDPDFAAYIETVKTKSDIEINLENKCLRSSFAYEFLIQKYTKQLYNKIGECIWGWCD